MTIVITARVAAALNPGNFYPFACSVDASAIAKSSLSSTEHANGNTLNAFGGELLANKWTRISSGISLQQTRDDFGMAEASTEHVNGNP